MTTGESQTPQFATAEYSANSAAMECAVCRRPIADTYFQIKGAPVCAACTDKVRAQIPQDSHAAFVRALLFGIGGAIVGFALYVIFALTTGLVIGYVSLAVGYIVGKAMHMGSRGVGGRRYQVVAVLLTYFAVAFSAVPIALQQARAHLDQTRTETPVQPQSRAHSLADTSQPRTHMSIGKAMAVLAWVGIASPFLDLEDPVHGLIGLVILFVGLRFAWTFTARRTVSISGPYTAAGAAKAT